MSSIFQGFWHGPPLTPVHRACLRSFVNHGHGFELYAYDPVDAGPGITLRDANEVLPRSEIFYFRNPVTGEPDIAPFSDLFRYKLLLERGGWWVDVDTACLTPRMPGCRRAWTRDNPEFQPQMACVGILRFPPGNDIMRLAFERGDRLRSSIERRDQLGSELFTPILQQLGLPPDMAINADRVCPLRWIEMFKLWLPEFAPEVERRLGSAWLLTICWSFAKYVGIDFCVLPPRGSILDNLLREHCRDSFPDRPRYGVDQLMSMLRAWFAREGQWALPELAASCGPEMRGVLGV